MIQNGRNYVYGSTAEQLEYDINEIFQDKKRTVAKKRAKSNNKARLKAICLILGLFAGCFILIVRYSIITEMNYKVASASKQYESIKSDNSRLKVDIQRGTDINKIRDTAQNQLGMHRPDKTQTIYVNVPKKDYTEVAEQYKESKNTNFLTAIINKFGEIAGMLF